MAATFDRQHVDAVLKRAGMSEERRFAMLDEMHFPIDLDALQAVLAPLGVTHDGLVNRMGGSP